MVALTSAEMRTTEVLELKRRVVILEALLRESTAELRRLERSIAETTIELDRVRNNESEYLRLNRRLADVNAELAEVTAGLEERNDALAKTND